MTGRGRPRTFDTGVALRQALALFWEHGYEGTSITDLASAMGIASASLYAAFGSKQELFRNVMELYTATAGQPPRQALLDHLDTRLAVHAMLLATVDQITRSDAPHYCMLILAAPTGAVENDEIREFLADGRRAQYAAVRARLELGIQNGDLTAPSESLDSIARYYTTVVQGLSLQARDGATRADLSAIVEAAMAGWDNITKSRTTAVINHG